MPNKFGECPRNVSWCPTLTWLHKSHTRSVYVILCCSKGLFGILEEKEERREDSYPHPADDYLMGRRRRKKGRGRRRKRERKRGGIKKVMFNPLSPLLCVGQQPARNLIDAAEKYPKNNKNKKQERKQTQYLTRFGNLPSSSGQGRERYYWFNNQYKSIQEGYFEGFLVI